jgi:hypothetical protein
MPCFKDVSVPMTAIPNCFETAPFELSIPLEQELYAANSINYNKDL